MWGGVEGRVDCGGVEGLEARLLTSEPSPFFMGTSSDELACPFSSDPPASFSVHMLGTGGSLALLLLPLLLLLLLPLALPDVVVVMLVVVVVAGEAMEALPLLLLLVVVVVVVVVVLLLTEGVLPLSAMLFSRSRWQSLRFRILLQHTRHDTRSDFCCNTQHAVRLLLQHTTHDTQHTTHGQDFAATHNTRSGFCCNTQHTVRLLLQYTTHDTRSGFCCNTQHTTRGQGRTPSEAALAQCSVLSTLSSMLHYVHVNMVLNVHRNHKAY